MNSPDSPVDADTSALQPTGPVLSCTDIDKRVTGPGGDLSILQSVSCAVKSGEAVAIVGPSGSGKSTLLGILAGLDTPSAGEVHMLGQSLAALDEDARAQLRAGSVGFVFQSFQLLPGLSALENVMLPLELRQHPNAQNLATKMLDSVGLADRADHLPLQLSGGEQQRVALARAFVAEPRLLFADEPTGNLDADTGDKVVDLMFAMRSEMGAALVLVTHDMSLAKRCDRTFQMAAGQLSEL